MTRPIISIIPRTRSSICVGTAKMKHSCHRVSTVVTTRSSTGHGLHHGVDRRLNCASFIVNSVRRISVEFSRDSSNVCRFRAMVRIHESRVTRRWGRLLFGYRNVLSR